MRVQKDKRKKKTSVLGMIVKYVKKYYKYYL